MAAHPSLFGTQDPQKRPTPQGLLAKASCGVSQALLRAPVCLYGYHEFRNHERKSAAGRTLPGRSAFFGACGARSAFGRLG